MEGACKTHAKTVENKIMFTLRTKTLGAPMKRLFGTYKTSTGLVGLAVDPHGRDTLLKLSAEVLEAVKVSICIISMTMRLSTVLACVLQAGLCTYFPSISFYHHLFISPFLQLRNTV